MELSVSCGQAVSFIFPSQTAIAECLFRQIQVRECIGEASDLIVYNSLVLGRPPGISDSYTDTQ